MAVPEQSFTDEDEEAEETISLCDLPIYSDDSNCDRYSKSDSFENGDTFFEFFSHDFSVSDAVSSRSDNIIFCGKLIPIRTNEIEYINGKRSRKLEKCELPAERAMVLRSSSATKSLWFLFLFGGGAGIRKEMELSEMRTRQRRRVPPEMCRPAEGGGKKKPVRGLWKVVRALVMGCTSSDRNVALNGSFTPIPLV